MRGGARNRSGPPSDPDSQRSVKKAKAAAAAGVDYTAMSLPREGWRGRPPKFPLPEVTDREKEVWRETWHTPQAAAWALEPWRHRAVAQYVRWSVRMEHPDAAAALASVVVRLADQIGLTPAGLRENNWVVARDEVTARRETTGEPPSAERTSARDRMQVLDGSAGV